MILILTGPTALAGSTGVSLINEAEAVPSVNATP